MRCNDFVTLGRNSSGNDSGLIDYRINLTRIQHLSKPDRLELLKVAQQMVRQLEPYCKRDDNV